MKGKKMVREGRVGTYKFNESGKQSCKQSYNIIFSFNVPYKLTHGEKLLYAGGLHIQFKILTCLGR